MKTFMRYRNTSRVHLNSLTTSLSWTTSPGYGELAVSIPLYHFVPRWLMLLIFIITLVWVVNPAHGESSTQDGHKREEAQSGKAPIALTPEQIRHSGIAIERVASTSIRETLSLYGRIVSNAEREQIVSARFPGVINKMAKQIGDAVQQGEILATVESNESLKTYPVHASLSGVVTQRNANVGEQTGDRALFVIGDYSTVWVDLSVFPADLSKVRVGQLVRIENRDSAAVGEGRIIIVLPVGSSTNQTTTARVLLDNPDRRWVPGHFVTAEVVLSETEVPTAIRDEAIQIVEEQPVVFVEGNEGFEARPVTLGRRDGRVSEVLEGLQAGEAYVSTNSFTLKSELGKGEAEHGH